MATKDSIKPVPSTTNAPRFSEEETEILFQKIAVIAAGIEAQWQAITDGSDPHFRGRYMDTIQVLAQVAGFIADHAGQDCSGYGDVFQWLEIPQGVKNDG